MRVVAFDMGRRNFAFAEMEVEGRNKPCHIHMFDVHDFGSDIAPMELFRSLIVHLDRFFSVWDRAHVILIEQQLSSLNIQANRLACHVAAYFFHKYPNLRVFEYPASYKTKLFGEQKTKHRERKQFAIQKVRELFEEQDPVAWDWISSFKKKDDVADCILMCVTFPLSPLFGKM